MLQKLLFFLIAWTCCLQAKTIYDIDVETLSGNKVSLSLYKGKVLLLCNIALQGVHTKQLVDLEVLYQKYKDQGFEVLAFPSNDFIYFDKMTNANIEEISKTTYGLTYDIFGLTSISGDDKSELYQFLTDQATNPLYANPVTWNFVKFLVNRKGEIINRFSTITKPSNPKIEEAIKEALIKKT